MQWVQRAGTPSYLYYPYTDLSDVLRRVMQIAATNDIEAYLIRHYL